MPMAQFEVITSEGERFTDVKLIGADPLNDIAFLKVNGVDDLPPATLGDSGTVRVGQKVVAIGNSLGQYQNTVTSGIVSGKGRPISAALDEYGMNVENLTDLLQTDAAINPGNSGGPLLNAAGQMIGINTAIVSDAQSMGFAIPINAAKGLVRGVLDKGEILKAYVGVQYLAITPEVRAEYELSEKNGALVGGAQSGSAIAKSGPAEQAGIKDGDIITKVNDKIVGEQGGLGSLTAEFLPGETIELTVVRGGKERSVRLTLGAYKAQG
jgi:serine protease Do